MSEQALLIIDVQQGLDNPAMGARNNPQAEANIARLLEHCREIGAPVLHVKHNSAEAQSHLRPNHPGNAFKPEARPLDGEPVFEKSVNSAFIGTRLEQHLREAGIDRLVVAGLTTEHCVSTSVRMAANLGFDVTLVSDATAAHDKQGAGGVQYCAQDVHEISLATLNGEFCQLAETKTLLASA